MNQIDSHFLAAFLASQTAASLLELLPETDLIVELRNLIYVQYELFVHMLEGKHYGTNDLNEFMDFCRETTEESKRLKESIEWKSE
jgi:hypothetical protein